MEQLVNFITRPPRSDYDPKNDLLEKEFMLKRKWFQRKDIEIKNSRGDTLGCSHYSPVVTPNKKPLPCVIYCHGNRWTWMFFCLCNPMCMHCMSHEVMFLI